MTFHDESTPMKKKTLLSWSSGKDSAWALLLLKNDPEIELIGLFSTVNRQFDRVAMHAVRRELLLLQAQRTGLPIDVIELPYPCSDGDYKAKMADFVARAKRRGIECVAFGDLFLEDIRRYREDNLVGTGIAPLFPLWGLPTAALSRQMVARGLRARITSVDPRRLPPAFAGRVYDHTFLADLPAGVDPCGENGEFHSFVFAGPMFAKPLAVRPGAVVSRDGFIYADLQLAEEPTDSA